MATSDSYTVSEICQEHSESSLSIRVVAAGHAEQNVVVLNRGMTGSPGVQS